MGKNFTPLLLLPGFIVFFACSKHETHPAASPVDSTAANVYLDPGTVNVTMGSTIFNSFDHTQAEDNNGFMNIMAKALVNNDTCVFSISFPDTLRTNISYASYKIPDTAYIGNDTINFAQGPIYFNTGFYDSYKGIVYISNVNNDVDGDTLVITTFDKSKHQIAGTFKAILTAGSGESPNITQTRTYATGSFNTYYNIPK